MATFVGTQSDFVKALKELIELDYDAVEAYQAAINRLDNTTYIEKLESFKADHQRHITELSILLKKHSEDAPTGPSLAKQWLTKGKVVLANLVGDNTILSAMRSNEEDTNKAYERMQNYPDMWQDGIEILKRGLEDERRHKAWFDTI
ncbi:DUF2383 domain-containing protein [Candidatus Finniella inopinata]|uniref:DUF2383 domain-containing protein n=1 Tax=Candidatus Finniella inopinata TaxID=1696036 RepID=A0A4Q7DG43_9PROT|nr:DUF2383 domain-containing protein [Candidatus Finniella inopinata]RZI45260.1 DUF2383 domain-containing protein [Candidatus Finniella inopinata]